MRTSLNLKFLPVFLCAFVSCDPDDGKITDTEPEEIAYTVHVAESSQEETVTDIDENPLELYFSVATEETEETDKDITISVAADPGLVETFNATNQTNHIALPETGYSLTETAVIQAGENDVDITIPINKSELEGDKTYLLPISIEAADGAEINRNDAVTYFIIKTNPVEEEFDPEDYSEYNTSNWDVLEASSEEPEEGEFGHGGLAIHMFDNDSETFWHTKWKGGKDEPPYYFVVDMKEQQAIHGFSFLGRQDNTGELDGRIEEITLEVSTDNETYTEAAVIGGIANTEEEQTFFLAEYTDEVRYFKITVTSWHGPEDSPKASLAELGVF